MTKYTLGLKQLPFEPDCHQIIYIDGSGNGEIENLIKYNYFGIRRCFEARGYDFCYIPYLKKELEDFEKIHYNAPYAKNGHAKYITDDNFLLNYMSEPKRRDEIPPSLLYYIPDFKDSSCPNAECVLRGIPITEQSFEQDAVLRNVLHEILNDIDNHPRNCSFEDRMSDMACEEGDVTADDDFDFESRVLMREIEERIERLREKGVKSYIIERLVLNNKRLSQLTITKQNRIFLHEYFMEIRMTPLPKAVYFLFLKHPEGIMFSYLPDFREELLEIYKNVKGLSYNEAEARKSVWDVTDPLSNSINEKCSRIREAFVSQFDDYWAKNYYIDGKRGEPKKVALPRHLVKWE